MEESKLFFEQDAEKKNEWRRENKKGRDMSGWVAQNREYFKQNDGSQAVTELREAFDIFYVDGENSRLPCINNENRNAFQDLAHESIELATRLLRCLSLALNKKIHFFENLHRRMLSGNNKTSLRSLYYPPIKENVESGSIRCGEHTDYGTLTFLYQDKYPGLQVKTVTDGWISVPPRPGLLMVNIGDMLEMWTNQLYSATFHRVVIPDEEIERKEARQSIAFFLHPDDQVMIEPLVAEINEEKQKKGETTYSSVSALQHSAKRFSESFKY
ncbi:probable 2-oxoglutarate-dependent dioxygenase At3g50210 [Eurytemora carolleeae]|uniref:probable 2-oxoglutarate-dependent dioxygenase At3g50210 n=1 Tax=Eurytemora carolleeae TaxID=1294199 RepID=UPI000C77662F|nr:probable 2-oxoglutarate-dependent dioxygenase At3g50210 [Eurytemora carolleeae]|eukprot:XP_023326661.1 probable 2-oxoglutarate-dependent dioxygenase At3g50210 [Eurytemora affinis]